jgi:hypothetical protein
MGLLAIALYIGVVAAIGVSAFKHREQGWKSGVFLAFLLSTIPVWVAAFYWLISKMQWLLPQPP